MRLKETFSPEIISVLELAIVCKYSAEIEKIKLLKNNIR